MRRGARTHAARAVVKALAEHGVRMSAYGPRRVRAIAHLDEDDAGIERAIEAFTVVLGDPARSVGPGAAAHR